MTAYYDYHTMTEHYDCTLWISHSQNSPLFLHTEYKWHPWDMIWRLRSCRISDVVNVYQNTRCLNTKSNNIQVWIASCHTQRHTSTHTHISFRVCKSVHHHTLNWINQPDAANFQVYYLSFKYSSTCFGHPHRGRDDHDQQHCYHQAPTVNQRLLLQLL